METPPLLIIWHSRTGASESLARAAAQGAGSRARLMACEDVGADAMLAASGYLFCAPENLASLSGLMKEMFDRLYYALLGRIEGRGFATIIAAGSDGEGAQRQLDRIARGWRLRRVAEPWIVNTRAQTPDEIQATKTVVLADLQRASELGAALAEGFDLRLF